jgi:hypothetical protein
VMARLLFELLRHLETLGLLGLCYSTCGPLGRSWLDRHDAGADQDSSGKLFELGGHASGSSVRLFRLDQVSRPMTKDYVRSSTTVVLVGTAVNFPQMPKMSVCCGETLSCGSASITEARHGAAGASNAHLALLVEHIAALVDLVVPWPADRRLSQHDNIDTMKIAARFYSSAHSSH